MKARMGLSLLPLGIKTLEEDSHNFGVKLGIGFTGDYINGPIDGEPLMERAVGPKAVECLGYEENPRLQRDLCPCQSIGISFSVESLMVMADDGAGFP